MTRVLDGAASLASARAGFICLFDERAERLSIGVFQGIGRDELRAALARPGFSDLFSGEGANPRPVSDYTHLAGLAPADHLAVAFPIRVEDQMRALLILFADRLDTDRVRLCQTFADQAALAIRNSQLYEHLGKKEAELASIVSSIANPVVVVDGMGRILIANPTAEELFSFSSTFMKGQLVKGLLGNETLETMLATERGGSTEIVLGRPTPKTWKARVSEIRQQTAGMGGRILVMDDVTTEREMEKVKADFIAVVGHELRTPMTLIKGFIKTLLRRGDQLTTAQRNDAYTTIESQAQRLERLIEDLLYVSRVETSRAPLHLESADLVAVLQGLLGEFHARSPSREFAISAPPRIEMMIDRTKTEQIAYHLLDNACKYSAPEAPVTVEVTETASEVSVSVVDKGVGILSGDIPELFQKFHQIDATSTRTVGGTGVGLYICKSLVEVHGGTIKVESAWGKGSRFTFTIPKGLKAEVRSFQPAGGSTAPED